MEPIFTCEYTGKSGLTFFGAIESEQKESEKTQLAFPDVLKPRVLRACHFRKFYAYLFFFPINFVCESRATADLGCAVSFSVPSYQRSKEDLKD